MKSWVLLAGAIAAEIVGTMSLRAAIDHAGWIPLVAAGYLTAFTLLGLTLRAGMPIGVAYAVWGAVGVAVTAALGALIFSELLSPAAVGGIGLIVGGVALLESGSRKAEVASP